jgi:hypothetical protein
MLVHLLVGAGDYDPIREPEDKTSVAICRAFRVWHTCVPAAINRTCLVNYEPIIERIVIILLSAISDYIKSIVETEPIIIERIERCTFETTLDFANP